MLTKANLNKVYLVGFMGTGKTTFGRLLSKKLGFDFFDIDKKFEEKYKTSIDLFFNKYGEDTFRNLEYEILKSTFNMENVVISTGGGTPCFFDSMELINKNGISIYLQIPVKTIYDRLINAKKIRPLVAKKSNNELINFIEEKLKEREPFYKKSHFIVSSLSIDVEFVTKIIKDTMLRNL